jgi:hypothetical protein
VVAGLQVNRLYHVREGVADPAAVDLRSFRWPAASGA